MSDPERPGFRWPDGVRAAVSFSFDDARRSQAEVGLDLLAAAGVKATFYVSPHLVDERPDAWKRAVAEGHEIGNHTLNHPCSGNFPFAREKALESYTLDRIEADMLDANAAIAERLGVTPTTFAYPCGQAFVGRGEGVRSYVPLVARHFRAGRGFLMEAHNDPGFCDPAYLFCMDSDRRSFQELSDLVERAVGEAGWLIFGGHEIGPDGARQTTSADALARLCEQFAAPGSDIWVDTVSAVAEHIHRQR